MGNQNQKIKKANNLEELKEHVKNVSNLINNSKSIDHSHPKIKVILEINEPNNEILKDTLWKFFTKVNCLVTEENLNNNKINNNKKLLIQTKLTFGQFYAFYTALRDYTGNSNNINTNSKTIDNNKSIDITPQILNNNNKEEKEKVEEEEDEDKLCPICFDNIADNVSGECMHIFCSSCINEWREKSKTCPMCRIEDPIQGDTDFFLLDNQIGIVEFLQKTLIQITK